MTNSERHISHGRAAAPPPGQAREDWSIAVAFARRLALLLTLEPGRAAGNPAVASRPPFPPPLDGERCESRAPVRATSPFDYATSESIWNEHRESTRGRDVDITGMSYPMLESVGPQQWPLKEGETTGRARLYEDGVFPTPNGRARFVDTPYKPVVEAREARYPFSLNTGRLRDQ